MLVSTSFARSQCVRGQMTARYAPETINMCTGQTLKVLIDAIQCIAILLRGPDLQLAAAGAELWLDCDFFVRQIALGINMIESMAAERMAVGHQRFPEWRPAWIERVIAIDSFFIGHAKRGLDVMTAQGLGDVLRL